MRKRIRLLCRIVTGLMALGGVTGAGDASTVGKGSPARPVTATVVDPALLEWPRLDRVLFGRAPKEWRVSLPPGRMAAVPGLLSMRSATEILGPEDPGPPDEARDPAELTPRPWVGEMGVTETVAEIMARDPLQFPQEVLVRPVLIKPDWRNLPQAPDAPYVAQWPPSGGPNAFTGGRVRFDPQTLSTDFLGVAFSESGFLPPDSMGGVSPSQVVVCTNGRIRVFSKTGTPGALNTSLNNFFNSVRNGVNTTDPRVRFDPTSGRWIIACINIAFPNRVLIAVSSSDVITNTSSFTFFQFQQDQVNTTGNTGQLADYPTMGVDANAVYIGANMFTSSGSYQGTSAWVVRKSSILGPGPIVVTAFRNLGLRTPQGVNNSDPAATQGYLIGCDPSFFGRLNIRRINDPGGNPTISSNINLTVPATQFPGGQPALGSSWPLDALDDRLFAAEIRKNRITGVSTLWTAHNFRVNTSGIASTDSDARNASRWYEIQNLSGTPSLRQSGTVFDNAASSAQGFWIPSIIMTGQGHAVMAMNVAGPNRRADIVFAGRLSGDPLGTLRAPVTAFTSTANYNAQAGGVQRWGDYSITVVDPADDMTVWTFQQYVNATNSWAVRAIRLLAPPPATPTAAAPGTVTQGATGVTVVVTATAVNGSGFFDPGPGFPNRLQATVSGTGVTVNSVTFNSPTQITLNLTVADNAPTTVRTLTITNPDGQTITSAPLLTVEAATVTVSGTITLEGAVNMAQPLTFEFRPQPSGTPFTRSITPGITGAYTVSNVPPGTYQVAIKGSKWLRRVISVNATASVSNADATLLAGDANDDNAVDVLDLNALITAFDAAGGDPNWNAGADLNGNGVVDVLDLDLLIRNFDLLGDP
ncbi:MAG: hypothetical protein RMJ43_05020 [Chloroherpetonaceae bacterium]|nr:hypothetical protein [Chthonomonadaceae bacterium]MDW8207177.1 hypothetical protein [Chloroherpetonaceae bacterium]